MTSKIQQAKNEKHLKELARLTENKRCAICTCMGTQYTCQPPSIFVCSTCAGAIYRFPGFRVKSRSMATYTTQEIQQMKQGGNGEFAKAYLAKWNPQSFPAPTDKNPKKVEEFVKQVLVDKVFYSETPVEVVNKPEKPEKPETPETLEPPKLTSTVSTRSLMIQSSSMKVENSFQALSDKPPPPKSVHAMETAPAGNWADFSSAPATKHEPKPFDPFAASSIHASPKSVHSTPADPFAPQLHEWDPFKESANGAVQPAQTVETGWSQFESKPVAARLEKAPEGHPHASTPTGMAKTKPTVLDPLPEEWFSVGASPAQPQYPQAQFTQQNYGYPPQQGVRQFQPVQQLHAFPQQAGFAQQSGFGQQHGVPQQSGFGQQHSVQQQSGFGQQGAFGQQSSFGQQGGLPQQSGFGVGYQQGSFAQQAPQASAFGFNQQPGQTSLGSYPSFRSAGFPQQWPQQQSFATMQKQDSMASFVSNRANEPSQIPLFQNLDMDMRGKAHSEAGFPVQSPSQSFFQSSTVGYNRTGTAVPYQQSFMTTPPSTGFEANGNPFA